MSQRHNGFGYCKEAVWVSLMTSQRNNEKACPLVSMSVDCRQYPYAWDKNTEIFLPNEDK